MCLSALLIFIYSLKIAEWVPAFGWEVHRTRGGGHKDGHQGFHPCESRFLYFLVWRRSESGDRFGKGERQRIFTSVSFSTCSQCQIPYCYTYRLLCATRSSGGCGRHLRIYSLITFNVYYSLSGGDGDTVAYFSLLHFQFSICFTFQDSHPGISESLPETPCRTDVPLHRLRRGRTADRTRSTAVLRPYQRALRWKR